MQSTLFWSDLCGVLHRTNPGTMNYDRYFIMSCLLGDELYKPNVLTKATSDVVELEKRFLRLLGQPIGDYITSGLPSFMLSKKSFVKV